MNTWIKKIHMYTGLLNFTILCVFGLAGLVATAEAPDIFQAGTVPVVTTLPFRAPGSASDQQVGELIREQLRPAHAGKPNMFTPISPALADDDCHHERQTLIRDRKRVVVYDTLVGVFGLARESMYRHARVVDRFGRAHLRGEDPITAAGIVIAVIAAAAVVAGAVIEIGCAN